MTDDAPPRQPSGPLVGIRFVELGGIGPLPLAGMVLADLGATGIRVDAPHGALLSAGPGLDPTRRGRPGITVDLRRPDGLALVRELAGHADVFLEGYRPGVAERLGVGPDDLRAGNPRLVYGRMTGWGQGGPLAARAGHDIDYVAVSGVLSLLGRDGDAPLPPLNLLADYGGGGMLLLVGVLAALVERAVSGRGQVVDAAMVDGVPLLAAMLYGLRAQGLLAGPRGSNLLDGGAPFYATYATADGGWLAVGALEPAFYAELVRGLGLDPAGLPEQYDPRGWPVLREAFAGAVAARPRAYWEQVFAGSDACAWPVLGLDEAADHPHLAARGTLVSIEGVLQPAAAPRFDRTPARTGQPVPALLDDPAAQQQWGLDGERLASLRDAGVVW